MRMRRPIADVVAEIKAWKDACGMSNREIAARAQISVAAVARLFADSGARTRYSTAVKSVGRLARVAMVVELPDEPIAPMADAYRPGAARGVPVVIRDAVMRTWDGTSEHARRLAAAIVRVAPPGAPLRRARR